MNSPRLTPAQNDVMNAMVEGKHVAFVSADNSQRLFVMNEMMKVLGSTARVTKALSLITAGKGSIKFLTPESEVRGVDFDALFADQRGLITSDMQWCVRVRADGAPIGDATSKYVDQ